MTADSFPLRWADANLLFGEGGSVCGLYRVECVSYPYLSDRDKRLWLDRLAAFAYSIEADFALWRVSRSYDPASYLDTTLAGADTRHTDPKAWRDYLTGHVAKLGSAHAVLPELYLAVNLAAHTQARSSLAGNAWRSAGKLRRRIEDVFGLGDAQPVTEAELAALHACEQQTYARVSQALPARRATTREVQWLLARAACRGTGEPHLDPAWTTPAVHVTTPDGRIAYQPRAESLLRVCDVELVEQTRRLDLHTSGGSSCQALLTLGALPDEATFPGPGVELLFAPLELLNFPVDCAVHVRYVSNREALGAVRKRVVDADQVFSEQADARTGPSWAADDNRTLARQLEDELQGQDHPPLLLTSISLAVGAETARELEQRVEQVRAAYSPVHLYRPAGMQRALWLDHLPQPVSDRAREWAEMLTVQQLAALMPIATHHTGTTDAGPYIGYVAGGMQRPVRFDTTRASRTSRPPSILVCGTLGSGKTICSQLLAVQSALRGSVVVDIDPKPDHNLHLVDELDGRVRVIELTGAEEHRGMLDPLVIAPTELREELCASYLTEILPTAPASWQTQIRKAVRRAIDDGATSSLDAIAHLAASDNPDARDAADSLGVWADAGLGRLAFAPREVDSAAAAPLLGGIGGAAVTTIRAGALALPDPSASRSDYTQSERLAIATLKLVAAYAMRLVSGDRSRAKVLLFDEAWFLLSNPDGRRLIDRLNRLGRSQNATLILATQQLADVGAIENLIGTRIIFGQETHHEAAHALQLLGLDPNDDALVHKLRSFRAGRCLIRDIDDQIADVQIDLPGQRLLDTLNTTPDHTTTP